MKYLIKKINETRIESIKPKLNSDGFIYVYCFKNNIICFKVIYIYM